MRGRPLRRISILRTAPTLITLASAGAGLASVHFAIDQRWDLAIAAVFVAAVLDALDGSAARLLNVASDFGAEMDSLVDFLSFGVAPGLILYLWSLQALGPIGWVTTLIYVACVALRLARFNSTLAQKPAWARHYFQGVPSPAGGALALLPLTAALEWPELTMPAPVVALWVLMAAALMVSSLPTFSLKKFRFPASQLLPVLAVAALLLALAVSQPWGTMSILMLLYLLSLPASAWRYVRLRRGAVAEMVGITMRRQSIAPLILSAALPLLLIGSGLYCLLFAIEKRWEGACLALMVALALNAGDALARRFAAARSSFGAHLMTLAHFVAFGVAPGALAYFQGLHTLGPSGAAPIVFFIACAALRLARTTAAATAPTPRAIPAQGIPVALGAWLVTVALAWTLLWPIAAAPVAVTLWILWMMAVAGWMVSTLPAPTLPAMTGPRLWIVAVAAAGLAVAVALRPLPTVAVAGALTVAAAPVFWRRSSSLPSSLPAPADTRPSNQDRTKITSKKSDDGGALQSASPRRSFQKGVRRSMGTKTVTLFGGSGQIGRHVTGRLASRGWQIRIAVRDPEAALFLKSFGEVGQIALVAADVRRPESVAAAVRGADAVVNLVGILHETKRASFDALHHRGAATIAEAAAHAGAITLTQVSALGADPASPSRYAQSKAAGEQAARRAFPNVTLLRPSLVFGPHDDFFNRFARLAHVSPALPSIGGGTTRFQPVYAGDVAGAIVSCVETAATTATLYELGGPEIFTFEELLRLTLSIIGLERALPPIPFWAAHVAATFLEWMPTPPLTRDQLLLLRRDNVVSGQAPGLRDLGVTPTPLALTLATYLPTQRRADATVFDGGARASADRAFGDARLLGPEQPIPGVAQPRQDIGFLVQALVQRCGIDRDVGVIVAQHPQPFRRRHQGHEPDRVGGDAVAAQDSHRMGRGVPGGDHRITEQKQASGAGRG